MNERKKDYKSIEELLDDIFAAPWKYDWLKKQDTNEEMFIVINAQMPGWTERIVKIIEDNPEYNWNTALEIVERICAEHNKQLKGTKYAD